MQSRLASFQVIFLLASLAQATPVVPRAWVMDAEAIHSVPFPAGAEGLELPAGIDLDQDKVLESLALIDGRFQVIEEDIPIWQSPTGWSVEQAAITDLNHDTTPEVTLLVWRRFQPWPVDQFLPYGGRIEDFHDERGDSCHIILIGLIRGEIGELWAGSALAQPVTSLAAADLDRDGEQELVTLEGRYSSSGADSASELKAWEWNGFGFSVVSGIEGQFSDLALARAPDGRILVLTP